jgi:hypothetical protein
MRMAISLSRPIPWESYIDPEFRDRAIRIRKDRDGLEVLEIGGRLSKYRRPGQLAQSGAMGRDPKELKPSPDRTYVNQAPFRSMDPKERLALLDQDGLDKAIIYPTLGLSWETEDVKDLKLQAAYAHAYAGWWISAPIPAAADSDCAHFLWRWQRGRPRARGA